MRNEEVLHRVKERNIIHTVKRREVNWIGFILRRNCLFLNIIEGKIGGIEVTGRKGRRHKQPLDNRKETRGYYTLKQEAPDRTVWRTGFGRGRGRTTRKMEYVPSQA